jgi:hypothetical protein
MCNESRDLLAQSCHYNMHNVSLLQSLNVLYYNVYVHD